MNHETNHSAKDRNIRLETIVVPIDFSEFSSKALQYALAFAEQFKSKLVLVAVVETPQQTFELGYMPSTLLEWDREVEKKISEKLATLAAESINGTMNYVCFTRRGEATEEILAVAATQRAGLIIMGTHGRTGMKHVILGSVAEKVVRHASCPVMVVRMAQREFIHPIAGIPRLELDEIIVPLDFSEGSSRSFSLAETIADQTGARLNLLHAVPFHYGAGEYDAITFSQLEADMMASGRKRLEATSNEERRHGLNVQSSVVLGAPREEILKYTEQQKGELIVMGTRGLTGIKHLLLGSTAEYVIRHASCAVLAVPYPKQTPKRKRSAEPSLAKV